MKFNDYVIAAINCNVTRLCSVKAKNPLHAIVKVFSNLYNEFYEDDEGVYPIDGNLLYEKFIENNKDAVDLEIENFVSKLAKTYVEFSDCIVSAIMENGVEIYNTED